ncbi:MAG: GrpB family protein, partial [Alphaproteobacteria bacterium]|nr:GrpB family protein [Alphaproteobacteria bacterium]
QLLHFIFGKDALNIHHIGSTAIPGIKAKPIIDILITTNDLKKIDDFDSQMEQLNYVIGGEFGLPGRRFYCKGDDKHCHFHVHIYEATHPSVEKYLLFRDYLITHPNDAKEYESLKTDLATKYPNNRTLYTQSKGDFINQVFEKAAASSTKT